MEKTKIVKIKDLENEKIFKIRLFNAEEGLDFMDKIVGVIQKKEFSIKPFLNDLLPLACLMDTKGQLIVKEGLTLQDCYATFENPLAVAELGTSILEFQKVFMTNSVLFRPLMKNLNNIWNIESSELETKSE